MLDSQFLADTHLSALAVGEHSSDVIRRLRAGQVGKHSLLIEALARVVSESGRQADAEMVRAAVALLAEIQSARPDVVADVLALPHIGFWAADCLTRLRGVNADHQLLARTPSRAELGHLASLAVTAALRAGHASELAVPMLDGAVSFPGLGFSQLAAKGESGWALARLTGDDATATSGYATTDLPTGDAANEQSGPASWTPVPRLRLQADGVELDVIMETRDPFLARLGRVASPWSSEVMHTWKELTAGAWRILVRHYRPMAIALAGGLSTLVPLRRPASGRPVSASSGWAWGAIALSLPDDSLSLAETLVHEMQHLVLSAVEDVTPLIYADEQRVFYAPWRDDPRPLPGLLQGCYAYLGVTALWRRLRAVGSPSCRLRGNVEFARRRLSTMAVADTLATTGALTETGQAFVSRMRDQLASWQGDTVPPVHEATAIELAAAHLLRWRLVHVRPDYQVVDVLVQAWLSGAPSGPAGLSLRCAIAPIGLAPTAVAAPAVPESDPLARLLERRYLDSAKVPGRPQELETIDLADAAFLRGDSGLALAGYGRRISDGNGIDGWIGLILTWCRLAGEAKGGLGIPRPELAFAVYQRIRELDQAVPRADVLISWLSR